MTGRANELNDLLEIKKERDRYNVAKYFLF